MGSAFVKHGERFMSEDGQQKIYFLPVFIYDYFNKIYFWHLENTGQNTLMLSREKPSSNHPNHSSDIFYLSLNDSYRSPLLIS